MALAQLQALLATLCTDPAARARCQADPAAFAHDAKLSPAEQSWLQAELPRTLRDFAGALLAKRTHEAARALPRTHAALAATYRPEFHIFAAQAPPARNPAAEAEAFLQWLLSSRDVPAPARAAAELDLAWLRAQRSSRRLQVRLFRHPGRTFLALWHRPRAAEPWRYREFPA